MKAEQKSLDDFAQVKARVKPVSVPRSREITRVLSRWPWLYGRAISIFRDAGLRELLDLLEPRYVLPTTTHAAQLIRKEHDHGVVRIKELLRNSAEFVALTTDIWTSKATRGYATTTVHFFSD